MSTPYQLSAVDYAGLGWSPIPLPTGAKWPPPDGVTGAAGVFVGVIKAEEWVKPRARYNAGNANFPPGNVALRLPKNVIGIDVDTYDEKAGASSLEKAEKAWGELPPTWISSSRRDGSGIRLFRVPEGLNWPESLRKFHGGGVEILRWDHRYAIVFPSVHPETKGMYCWCRPDGEWVTDEVPGVDELAELPDSWVAGLTEGKEWVGHEAAELDQNGVRDWLKERDATLGTEICDVMTSTLSKYGRQLMEAGEDGGAHDEGRNGVWALLRDAAAGHSGVNKALAKLRKTFLTAVGKRRGEKQAREEWARALMRGVAKVVAEGTPEDSDPCAMISDRWRPRVVGADGKETTSLPRLGGTGSGEDKRRGSSAFDWTRDDIGNGQRICSAYGGDMLNIPGLGGWHTWTGKRWERDKSGQTLRWAMELVRNMDKEAEFIEDLKERAAFAKFIRSSGMMAKLRAMLDAAAGMRGMTVDAEEFDSDPRLLLTPNGVLELGDNGVVDFRPVERSDKLTKLTRAEYHPDAVSADWDKFLSRAVPDLDTRHWLQKALGYSMYGRNPGRLLFMIQGATSSGKSTVVEAVAYALGEYASTFSMSLFRSEKQAGANPQLFRVMTRRFIRVSETSSEWTLHADQIKRVTGGSDHLEARLLYSNELVSAAPAFTPWIVCNDPPVINGADLALYRRMFTVPFNETIPEDEEDVRISERLHTPEGSAAVLAWLVEGWKAWGTEGLRDTPAAITAATMKTREELSEFDAFLRDCTSGSAESAVASKDLYTAYTSWCEDSGVKGNDVESANSFGRSLSKRGYGIVKKRLPESRSRVSLRTGMRLRSGWAKRVAALETVGWEGWWEGSS